MVSSIMLRDLGFAVPATVGTTGAPLDQGFSGHDVVHRALCVLLLAHDIEIVLGSPRLIDGRRYGLVVEADVIG